MEGGYPRIVQRSGNQGCHFRLLRILVAFCLRQRLHPALRVSLRLQGHQQQRVFHRHKLPGYR